MFLRQDSISEDHPFIPEKRLLFAVVERALFDLSDTKPEVREGALGWINAESRAPFTFLWIVESLDLNETLVRRCRKRSSEHAVNVEDKILNDVVGYQRGRKAHCGKSRYNYFSSEAEA